MTPDLSRHWGLETGLDFLNHGSFGACPRGVLEVQHRLRDELERQPVAFLGRGLADRLDAAREQLASFLGAEAEGLVAIPNSTSGVNAVLRSLDLRPADELLVSDHAYNACRNALDFVADRAGARVVVAPVPFPVGGSQPVVDAFLERVTGDTRLALIDHVASPTGVVMPVETLVSRLTEQGVESLVDGAHAPGMLPLDLRGIDATYYVGNCHKWLCAPKGAAFLYVTGDRRSGVRPLTISHGANIRRPGRSRFHDEFDWMGTDDPTAFLSVPAALDLMQSMVPGGWPEIMNRNHALAIEARDLLVQALGIEPPCPDDLLGSMATVPLPDDLQPPAVAAPEPDPLQAELLRRHRIEVPIIAWPAAPRRCVRVSAQLYNSRAQYERLCSALMAQRPASR